MSDAKTKLTFKEFSDLCRGSIGYSHHMIALFDECDDVKHFRHPISFIEAVKRLKKTIKRLFERLEKDNKKHVEEYEIGTYCWKSNVGNTVNLMKPFTPPVVIKKQCDGMIIIACITDELIPKAIKEKKRNDSRMDPFVYAHGLTQALIQHFTFNSPDNRLRNKTYDYNTMKLSSVEAVAIYVIYNFRQESTIELDDDDRMTPYVDRSSLAKLLKIEEQGKNFLNMQLEEIGLQGHGGIQQDDGNSFFLACIDQLKYLGIDAVNYLELKQMVISQLKFLSEADYQDEFTRTEWLLYVDRLSKNAKECIKDVVVRTTGAYLNQNIIIYHSGNSNEPVTSYFPRNGIQTALVLAEENNYYIGLEVQQWQERMGIKRPADSNLTPESPTKKVDFNTERQGLANSGQSTSTDTTSRLSADSQVPSRASTLLETTIQSEIQPQRKPAIATDTTPTKQESQQKRPKSDRKTMKKMTKDEKILILDCYNKLNVKTDYGLLAEMVYEKRIECLSRELVQHYENILDVSTTLKSRIKDYIHRLQRGKYNETDQEVKDLIRYSGLSRNDNASAESNQSNTVVSI